MSIPAPVLTQMRDQIVDEFQREGAITLNVFKAIPSAKMEFKPHPKSMGFGELAWHIPSTESWFIYSIASGAFERAKHEDFPKERPSSTEDLVRVYEKLTTQRVNDLKRLNAEQLGKEIDFMGIAKLPAIAYMRWCLSHAIHHRGQLSVYLRLVEAKVPSIYGPSADDNPFEKK
jgi:uncharacterized damage-inducible protein DinB